MIRLALITTGSLVLAGCATATGAPVGTEATTAPATAAGSSDAPDTMRWLYGSGEAAAASIQTWRQIADYAVAVASAGATPRSVPMGLPGYEGGIGAPSCTSDDGVQKPLAAVFDVDETVLLNTGYEYWQALSGKGFDPAEWGQWERGGAGIAPPVPGAVTGIRRLREAGITVIFNTNRDTGSAAGTVAALEAAGVGPAIALLVEDPSRGHAARAHGLEMHPYTVRATRLPAGYADAGAYMRYLFDDLRATGVFTDNPDLFPRR